MIGESVHVIEPLPVFGTIVDHFPTSRSRIFKMFVKTMKTSRSQLSRRTPFSKTWVKMPEFDDSCPPSE
ncbi:MAG: hypothetical protein V1731_03345 [Candidatus Aenigmatarchaeota archaeon]